MQLFQFSNGTNAIGLPSEVEGFSANNHAVRVNYFWFLSLTFGLICALAATLVQQWARSYLQAIERHPSPKQKGTCWDYSERLSLSNHRSPSTVLLVLWHREIQDEEHG